MRLTALVLLLAAPVCARAQEPPKTIDQIIDRIADLKKQRADLERQEQTVVGDLKAELKKLNDRIDKLGLLDGPGPAPKPPAPVDPPKPADQLRAKLRAALDAAAGTSAEKAEWAKDLAALYRAAAKLAADPTLATAAALRGRLKDASAALVGPDALKEVRQVVAAELAAVLPTADADLTDAQRAGASALFKRLAEVLDGM